MVVCCVFLCVYIAWLIIGALSAGLLLLIVAAVSIIIAVICYRRRLRT